jgi:hypothetical protein
MHTITQSFHAVAGEYLYCFFVILQITTGRYFGSTDAAFNEIQNPDGSNTEAHIGGK